MAATGPTVAGLGALAQVDKVDMQAVQTIAEKPSFDPVALKAKYLAEREKRIHNGGQDQYRELQGSLQNWVVDPYAEPGFTRDPVEIDVDVVIVGGGYGGELVAARLVDAGITNFRIIEKAGDFGGTWYWNRYPGAQCDIESYIYMPLLEEVGSIPSEKYAHSSELLAHAQNLGKRYDLYSKALFQTEVLGMQWDDASGFWAVETSRQDKIRARFVVPVAGPMHKPKFPGLSGIESFKGTSFHSSRWDYDYTGGDSTGGLSKLADKRVGIIGTGATSIQLVPQLAAWAKELYVFQRTPSSIDVRNNSPTDPEWAKSLKRGWQKDRVDNFTTILSGGYQETDLVCDAWTSVFKTLRMDPLSKPKDPEAAAAQFQLVNFEKMEYIRDRIASVVQDEKTAESLKPWYNYFCKRPCCHDEYLQAYNQPNVHLVDTQGKGVSAITPKGIVANGQEYELDLIIYATGFEVLTDWARRSGIQVRGRQGQSLGEKWKDGASTLHGWTTRGFPNCFFVHMTQAAQAGNYTHISLELSTHLAYVVSECQRRGIKTVEPTEEVEKEWTAEVLDKGRLRSSFLAECTPSYLNEEGNVTDKTIRNASYGGGPAGALAYWGTIKKWREDGGLAGLDISYFDAANK